LVSSVPISEKLFIGVDLNGHIGSTRVGFDGVHGGFGYRSRDQEGRVLMEGPWHKGGDANSTWMKMSTCIRKVASEEFGVTKGGKRETKET
jgi:hypothetical protein